MGSTEVGVEDDLTCNSVEVINWVRSSNKQIPGRDIPDSTDDEEDEDDDDDDDMEEEFKMSIKIVEKPETRKISPILRKTSAKADLKANERSDAKKADCPVDIFVIKGEEDGIGEKPSLLMSESKNTLFPSWACRRVRRVSFSEIGGQADIKHHSYLAQDNDEREMKARRNLTVESQEKERSGSISLDFDLMKIYRGSLERRASINTLKRPPTPPNISHYLEPQEHESI